MNETAIKENKELDKKVSINKHNDWSLMIPTDVLLHMYYYHEVIVNTDK